MVFNTPTDWWLQRPTVVSKTAAYTALSTDSVIFVDASGGAVTITLPPSGSVPGKDITVKKTDTSTNIVTVATAGSETIEGRTDLTLFEPRRSVMFLPMPDGTGWWIVQSHSIIHEYNFSARGWAVGVTIGSVTTGNVGMSDPSGGELVARTKRRLIGKVGINFEHNSTATGNWIWRILKNNAVAATATIDVAAGGPAWTENRLLLDWSSYATVWDDTDGIGMDIKDDDAGALDFVLVTANFAFEEIL